VICAEQAVDAGDTCRLPDGRFQYDQTFIVLAEFSPVDRNAF